MTRALIQETTYDGVTYTRIFERRGPNVVVGEPERVVPDAGARTDRMTELEDDESDMMSVSSSRQHRDGGMSHLDRFLLAALIMLASVSLGPLDNLFRFESAPLVAITVSAILCIALWHIQSKQSSTLAKR